MLACVLGFNGMNGSLDLSMTGDDGGGGGGITGPAHAGPWGWLGGW